MWAVRHQLVALGMVLGFQAVMFSPLAFLILRRRGRFQFSLATILGWGFPLAAIAAWIMSWDGPFFDPRRVVTGKVAALVLLESVCVMFFGMRWLWSIQRGPAAANSTSQPETPIVDDHRPNA
jgi:hypothetical protein